MTNRSRGFVLTAIIIILYNPLIRPYFLGGGVAFDGVPLDSHTCMANIFGNVFCKL